MVRLKGMGHFSKNYSIHWEDERLKIRKRGYKGLFKFLIVFSLLLFVLWTIGPVLLLGKIADYIFVSLVALLCFSVLWRMSIRWLYPHSDIYFSHKKIVRRPMVGIFPKITIPWKEIKDVVVLTKSVSENANSTEGRVIDYRKSIRIITEKEEIEIIYLISREEDLEKELQELAEDIQKYSVKS